MGQIPLKVTQHTWLAVWNILIAVVKRSAWGNRINTINKTLQRERHNNKIKNKLNVLMKRRWVRDPD